MLLGITNYQKIQIVINSEKIRISIVVTLLAMLTACTDTRNIDLERYVQRIKAKPAKRISPLPEFKMYETFSYSAENLRDPFTINEDESKLINAEAIAFTTGPKPDENRNKETLEEYPLDTLRFVGHLEKDNENWAIVTSPDRLVHRVKVGNYLGQNYGRITAVSETEMEIIELVPDGMGGWIEREAALSLGN